MNYKKIIGLITLETGVNGLAGTFSGWLGATVLKGAGYSNYIPWEGAASCGTGSAVIGVLVGTLRQTIHLLRQEDPTDSPEDRKTKSELAERIGEIVIGIGTNVLGSMLGRAILNEVMEMALGKTVASAAVGSALCWALVLCCACCCSSNDSDLKLKEGTRLLEMNTRESSRQKPGPNYSATPLLKTEYDEQESGPMLTV